jgi:predicted amidohydrolase
MQGKIAAIQMTSNADVAKNLQQAGELIAQAVGEGAQLVVLPENFAVMGIDEADKVKAREKLGEGPIQDFLSAQAAQHHIWLVAGTIPLATDETTEKVYATCLVFNDQGNVVARYDKIHLFDVNIHTTSETYHESKSTQAGNEIITVATPFGKLGLAVCYDIRFPEFFRAMHDQGVEIIILSAAFTFVTGVAHWDVLVRARAIENQVYMVTSAQTGTHESGRKTYGHSMIVDPWGVTLSVLPEGQGVVIADLDLTYLQKIRREFPVLMHRII